MHLFALICLLSACSPLLPTLAPISTPSPAATASTCPKTQPETWTVMARGGPPAPQQVLVGGNLLVRSLPVHYVEVVTKSEWLVRGGGPQRPELLLRGERLDRPAPQTEYRAAGVEGIGFYDRPEWGGTYGYNLSRLRFPRPGCWRVCLVGGEPGDCIVFEVHQRPEQGQDGPRTQILSAFSSEQ